MAWRPSPFLLVASEPLVDRPETLSRVEERACGAGGSCERRAAAGEAGAAKLRSWGSGSARGRASSPVVRSRSGKSAAPASPAAARRGPWEPGRTLAVRPDPRQGLGSLRSAHGGGAGVGAGDALEQCERLGAALLPGEAGGPRERLALHARGQPRVGQQADQ